MSKKKTKQYACFTPEQQSLYDELGERQRRYVDFRGAGNSKTQSYIMAGFKSSTAGQGSYLLEKRNIVIQELVECLQKQFMAKHLEVAESEINKQIDALARQQDADNLLAVVKNADSETAKRIQFYRDVINGKIQTVKKRTRYNAKGEKIETSVEKISDVETKMKARRELDYILGLNQVVDLDKFKLGDITINIVDAAKRNEIVELDPEKVEIVDGEQVLDTIEESEHEQPPKPNSEKVEVDEK